MKILSIKKGNLIFCLANEAKNKSKTFTPSTNNKKQSKTAVPRTNTSTRSRQSELRLSSENIPTIDSMVLEKTNIAVDHEDKAISESQCETPLKANIKPSRKSLRINPDLPIVETQKDDDKNSDNSLNESSSENEKNDSRESNESVPRKRSRVSMKELKGLEMWSAPISPNKRLKQVNSSEFNRSELNDDDLDANSMRVETDDLDQTVEDKSKTKIGSMRKSSSKKELKMGSNEKDAKNQTETENKEINAKAGVNRRNSVLFKRKSKKNLSLNSKNDSVSDISATDSNHKDLMNISGSTNQSNESN